MKAKLCRDEDKGDFPPHRSPFYEKIDQEGLAQKIKTENPKFTEETEVRAYTLRCNVALPQAAYPKPNLRFLFERVAHLDDPRSIGEALKGSRFHTLWKYRVGDYRIITSIEDNVARILIVKIGDRKEVYR
jgi:mRNA interferase RelE/StbE